jgi:ParB-like nuclease family protein
MAVEIIGIPEGITCLDPKVVQPPHEPREREKYRKLVASMRRGGWRGRPLLVIETSPGRFQALTGSHRIAAARDAGLASIPVIVMPPNAAEVVRHSRYFPTYPPGVAQDLFEHDHGWFGRFILLDQLVGDRPKPWSSRALQFFRELGHEDMLEVLAVEKWPCEE